MRTNTFSTDVTSCCHVASNIFSAVKVVRKLAENINTFQWAVWKKTVYHINWLYGPHQANRRHSNRHKMRTFRSSCASSMYRLGHCSPPIYFVVSNDSVSWQWMPDQTVRMRRLISAFAVCTCPKRLFSHGSVHIVLYSIDWIKKRNTCTHK